MSKQNLCTITHTILTESRLFFVYKQKTGDSIITDLRFLKKALSTSNKSSVRTCY